MADFELICIDKQRKRKIREEQKRLEKNSKFVRIIINNIELDLPRRVIVERFKSE